MIYSDELNILIVIYCLCENKRFNWLKINLRILPGLYQRFLGTTTRLGTQCVSRCRILCTIDSEGFKEGTRGAPIMPRDEVSRTANVGTVGTNGLRTQAGEGA